MPTASAIPQEVIHMNRTAFVPQTRAEISQMAHAHYPKTQKQSTTAVARNFLLRILGSVAPQCIVYQDLIRIFAVKELSYHVLIEASDALRKQGLCEKDIATQSCWITQAGLGKLKGTPPRKDTKNAE